jgi:hypothetical protein
MNDILPLPTATNGRLSGGRFGPGNRFAKGNPLARRVARLRTALVRSITPATIRRVVEALVREAEAGNVQAARELLNRTIGRETIPLIVEQVVRDAEIAERATNDEMDEELVRLFQSLGVAVRIPEGSERTGG